MIMNVVMQCAALLFSRSVIALADGWHSESYVLSTGPAAPVGDDCAVNIPARDTWQHDGAS